MSQHVPAWKKLGLKLKYAKDTADDAPGSVSTTPPETNGNSHAGTKRPRGDDFDRDQGSTKKHKKHSNPVIDTLSEPPAVKGILSGSQSPTKTPAKKSVQFSAETKAEDGETGQNYFKAWAAGGQPHTPPKTSIENSIPETPESAEKANTETHESPAETKAKTKASKRDTKVDQAAAQTQDPSVESQPSLEERRKSKAAKKAAKQERNAQTQAQQPVAAVQAPQSAYLNYLHQFHHDKRNWKFNKSKENHLLKNVWSTYRVPAQYTDALISYIAGLQGAGARGRLVEGADAVLQDVSEKNGQNFDFSGYEEPSTRREAYSSAVKRLRESSEPKLSQEDVDRAARAEAVLTQLLNHAPAPVAKPTTVTSAGGAKRIQFADEDEESAPAPAVKQPAKRKRKARTDVSSDESSSDSSSSESESDSDDSSSEDSSNSDGSSGSDSDSD